MVFSSILRAHHHVHALTGFQFMRLSSRVKGMIRNYQRIIDGCLADAPQKGSRLGLDRQAHRRNPRPLCR